MKLIPGVFSWSYHRQFNDRWSQSFDEFVEKATALKTKYGFEKICVDFGVNGGINCLSSYDEAYLKKVKQTLDANGLIPVPIIGDLHIHPDEAVVNASIAELERAIEVAAIIGAKHALYYHDVHGRLTPEKAVRILRDALVRLSKKAVACDVFLSAEEYCSLSGDQIYDASVGIPNVGLLNDIGNWWILGEDPVAATKKFIDITDHVHIKDYILKDGVWTCVPFGDGKLDIIEIMNIYRNVESDKELYVAFETDLDCGDEDDAMDRNFQYFVKYFL